MPPCITGTVSLVTSGAIAAGREHLGHLRWRLPCRTNRCWRRWGPSSSGYAWGTCSTSTGCTHRPDAADPRRPGRRGRYQCPRHLRTLLDHRIIPVINENDAVATAEIKVGDNDNLSARAAILADADLLVLLTDQKGLFTADPRTNPDAQLIEEVQTIDDTLRSCR